MKDFILCQSKFSTVPYLVGNQQEPVRSMAELCFYMQGHLFLLDETFFEEGLFQWIQNDLEMQTLASSLRDMKAAGRESADLTQKIFDQSGLYDREELNALHHMIVTLQDKSAVERQVIYGDYLLSQKEYREALSIYLDLQKEGRSLQMSEELQRRVLYHTGVIYARFLLFAEAAEQFTELYRVHEDEKGLQGYVLLKALAEREGLAFPAMQDEISYEEEDMEAAAELLDRLSEDASFHTAQDTTQEALAEQLAKDAWIHMLLKKYKLVDSI